MAYETWSQVVMRTVIEWEKQNELKRSPAVEQNLDVKRKRKSA
ncbi:hypothetical protein [Aetokthonos hydrillicola]|nr:hypothetical protein [Aetokthonos hydrillicola]